MYQYDPTGTNPENKITERFCLSSNVPGLQAWVPHGAPFFTKDLKIKNLYTNEILTFGKDYVFADDFSAERTVAESNIYNTVLFIGSNTFGMYEGTYRTIGGGLVYETRSYLIKLASKLLNPPEIAYSYVTNIPTAFPPDHHLHDWSDYRNKKYIAVAIKAVTDALKQSDAEGTVNLAPLQKELSDISKYMDAIDLPKHADTIDAHHTRAADVGALPVGAPAADAYKLFDMTLRQLVDVVRTEQKGGVSLKDYVSSESANNYVKSVILSQNAVIETPGGDTGIEIIGDSLIYKSKGSVDFSSNVDNDGVLTLQAGKNALELRAYAYGYQIDTLFYNGYAVITAENVRHHMDRITFDEQTVVTQNNEVAIMRGDGSRGKPLSIDVVLQDATDLHAGVAQFTREWGQSRYLVIESDLVKGLITDLSGYVPRERKINGYSMTDNIVIGKDDPNINLGNVDNTSDSEKPISTAQQTLLDGYSDKVHSHNYVAPTASPATLGVAKLNTIWTGDETGFVAPSAFAFVEDALAMSRGKVFTYAGEAIDPDAIYAVIRDVPTIKRGRNINLITGETYMVIK